MRRRLGDQSLFRAGNRDDVVVNQKLLERAQLRARSLNGTARRLPRAGLVNARSDGLPWAKLGAGGIEGREIALQIVLPGFADAIERDFDALGAAQHLREQLAPDGEIVRGLLLLTGQPGIERLQRLDGHPVRIGELRL